MAYKLPKRSATYRKYKAIQDRHKYLYQEQRLRYDDCNQKVMKEFFIDHEVTLMRILNTELPEEAPKKGNPAQLDIYGNLPYAEPAEEGTGYSEPTTTLVENLT